MLAAWTKSMRGSIGADATVGAFDSGRLVGSARYHVMQQWWHGRSMPMAAVGGVKVAPELRGRGLGTAMMARLLGDIADRGYPVSALYPATAPLYRAFGWEIAGGRYETVLSSRSLAALLQPDDVALSGPPSAALSGPPSAALSGPPSAALSGPLTGPPPVAGTASPDAARLRRATPDDGPAIVAVKGLVHKTLRHCGPNTREPWELRDWLDDPDHFAYLADDGFLSYRWAAGTDEISIREINAVSPATARAFWQVVGSHATMASQVRARVPPDAAVQWLTREPDAVTCRTTSWMLRVVDAPAAIAARGYPAGASVSVQLDLTDADRPANTGRWRLEVADGAGHLERAAGDSPANALRLGPRGLAALFGGAGVGTLRLAGLVAGGDPGVDDALGCAFGGHAFLIDTW